MEYAYVFRHKQENSVQVDEAYDIFRQCLLVRKTERMVSLFEQKMWNFRIFSTDKENEHFFSKGWQPLCRPLGMGITLSELCKQGLTP